MLNRILYRWVVIATFVVVPIPKMYRETAIRAVSFH